MTETFKPGIGNLFPEFFAHTYGVRCFLQPARTITVFGLQSFSDYGSNFLIRIEYNLHKSSLIHFSGLFIVQHDAYIFYMTQFVYARVIIDFYK